MEALLTNHSAERPFTARVARLRHTMGHCKIKGSLCSVQQVWWSLTLGAAAGLGRKFRGAAVLLNAGVLKMWGHRSATTAYRALPVCDWPALGIPRATTRLNSPWAS